MKIEVRVLVISCAGMEMEKYSILRARSSGDLMSVVEVVVVDSGTALFFLFFCLE